MVKFVELRNRNYLRLGVAPTDTCYVLLSTKQNIIVIVLVVTVVGYLYRIVVVVFFTLTDRASTIPSGCQSGTWSQRGTKVNRSHHGDNPLLRPTGIQIATKSYATLQAMAHTNIKTFHQTSFTPSPVLSACPLHTNSGCGKERRILIGPW